MAKFGMPSQRVLLIDDSSEDRAMVRSALVRGGTDRRYEFLEAENAVRGLELCNDDSNLPIDCIIVDFHMPQMTGVELLGELLEGDIPRFPVIVLTGSSGTTQASQALQAGAQDYLTKDAIYPVVLSRLVDNAIERHVLMKRLKNSERAADSANRAKSALIGNISHEIRTPMTAVLGLCDVLLQSSLNDDQRNLLSMIRDNGSYLVEIVNDLLDISKMEAGMLEIKPLAINLRDFLDDLISIMGVRANENSTTLDVGFADDVPEWIFADPIRLRQILLNLLSNAIKFTPNGKVRLEAQNAGNDSQNLIRFVVEDNGCGIPQEDLENIFLPFMQSGTDLANRSRGTGLGLSICRRLIVAMGGRIDVESVIDEGSSFTITLPLVEAHESMALQEKQTYTLSRTVEEILADCEVVVAEDTRATQVLMRRFIEASGGKVTVLEDGQQLVAHVREHHRSISVVITDLQMPVLDGLDATRAIREFDPHTPVLVLTADALAETRSEAMQAGADDLITKPIDREKFLEMLAHWCECSSEKKSQSCED